MNLLHHRDAVARVSKTTKLRICNYFGAPMLRGNLAALMHEQGLCQADLVLCLLRLGAHVPEHRRIITRLIGHDIVVCPPCLRGYVRPPRAKPVANELIVTWVGKNKFVPNTGRGERFALLKPGMTLSQYRARGGRRRDLRCALANGSIRVKEAA